MLLFFLFCFLSFALPVFNAIHIVDYYVKYNTNLEKQIAFWQFEGNIFVAIGCEIKYIFIKVICFLANGRLDGSKNHFQILYL